MKYAIVATIGVGIGLSILGAVSTLATVLIYIGIAVFLSLAFDPVIQLVTRRHFPRWAATIALGLVFLAAIVGLVFTLTPSATEQVTILGDQLFDFGRDLPQQEWFIWVSTNIGASVDLHAVLAQVTNFLSDPNQLLAVGGGLLKVGTGIIDGVTGVIIVSILTIYFTLTLPAMKAKAYRLVARSQRARFIELSEEILQSVGRYVGGQVTLALINALFTFVLMSILGTPAPTILAVIAFVGALIPVVGTVFGSAIAVLVTLTVSPGAALIATIVLLIYMQLEAYVLSPRVMAKAVAVPGALVIIAAFAGASLGGVLGALVAVPVAAAGLIILDRIILPKQETA